MMSVHQMPVVMPLACIVLLHPSHRDSAAIRCAMVLRRLMRHSCVRATGVQSVRLALINDTHPVHMNVDSSAPGVVPRSHATQSKRGVGRLMDSGMTGAMSARYCALSY